jgi:hypothetical protein
MQVGKFTNTEMCVTLQPKNKSERQNQKRNATDILQAIQLLEILLVGNAA